MHRLLASVACLVPGRTVPGHHSVTPNPLDTSVSGPDLQHATPGPQVQSVFLDHLGLTSLGNCAALPPACSASGVVTQCASCIPLTDTTGRSYLMGSSSAKLTFPNALLGGPYTLISIARYQGSSMQRIFDATSGNWTSGFFAGTQGVAVHGGALETAPASLLPALQTSWILSSDQPSLYRVDLTTVAPGSTQSSLPGSALLTVNNGAFAATQSSSWAVSGLQGTH